MTVAEDTTISYGMAMQPGAALLVRCGAEVVYMVFLHLRLAKGEEGYPRQRIVRAEH